VSGSRFGAGSCATIWNPKANATPSKANGQFLFMSSLHLPGHLTHKHFPWENLPVRLSFVAARRVGSTMNIDQLRKICLGFPGATEQMQWEDDLLFKVGGKMFAITPLEPARLWLSIKADLEEFAELIERPGILPAPYLARAKWIAIETPETLSPTEVAALLRKSYDLVLAKLPRGARESLCSPVAAGGRKKKKKKTAKRRRGM
jgi:predicted DNA-binding protein (MmcQ/YjbR family)